MPTVDEDLVGATQAKGGTHGANRGGNVKDTSNYVRNLLRNSSFKYLGISLLLTYHYVLWFVPDSFFSTELLNDQITEAWLVSMVATAITMFATALLIKGKAHLSDKKGLAFGISIGLGLCTISLQYLPGILPENASIYLLACIAGSLEGLMLILWGECLTRMHAQFSMPHFGMTFAGSLVLFVTLAIVLPGALTPVLTATLVLASGALLISADREEKRTYPTLLPRKASRTAMDNALIVCVIGFLTGVACYFLAAIIPWEALPLEQSSFVVGVLTMGACLFMASAATHYLKQQSGIFKLFPWFLVLTILALCLFMANEACYVAAFLLSLSVSCILEISLIVYFGILVKRGFFPPVVSFALSIGCARIGIACGNALAIFYERTSFGTADTITYTCLGLICLLAIALIPMSKREWVVLDLISAPATPAQVDVVCNQIIEEFNLSEREGEILKLIARGNTASNVANKLVISPHTVNTHIRHIYDKVNIHKRSELIEYINMRKSED